MKSKIEKKNASCKYDFFSEFNRKQLLWLYICQKIEILWKDLNKNLIELI